MYIPPNCEGCDASGGNDHESECRAPKARHIHSLGRQPQGFDRLIMEEPRRGDRYVKAISSVAAPRLEIWGLASNLGLTPQAKYLPPLRGSWLPGSPNGDGIRLRRWLRRHMYLPPLQFAIVVRPALSRHSLQATPQGRRRDARTTKCLSRCCAKQCVNAKCGTRASLATAEQRKQ